MNQTEILAAVEAIKVLKARYFRAVDAQDWDLMRQVLADDVVCDFRGASTDPVTGLNPAGEVTEVVLHGGDRSVAAMAAGMAGVNSVHHGHMPEIEITGPDSAKGVWAMFDSLRYPAGSPVRGFEGWGHYHETYARTGSGWRIASIRLTRLRLDFDLADAS
jgi:hypothetical protein